MIDSKYLPIIGLEVHVELATKSKMFCRCANDYFGKEPNSHCCPVCLGLPGALPVTNLIAIEWCVKIALSLNCEINEFSKFDRKNYFYPDLPKGYQISQYDLPFGKNGFVILNNKKRIRIRRVHMEEDTGKLSHQVIDNKNASLIDFNRSGVPLVEIVTEPDFNDSKEVKEYLQKLRQIVRYLGVSEADMEKGEMRLEPNISLWVVKNQISKVKSQELPGYKVEVKNINSFRFVEKAIEYEVKRQAEILEKGETPSQETRGWDENRQRTFSQRLKEEAMDYRYFPEPDIPPMRWKASQISSIKSQIPELPDAKFVRFQREFGLPHYDAEILTRETQTADFFEKTVELGKGKVEVKTVANWIINKKINVSNIEPGDLIRQITAAKKIIAIDEKALLLIVEQVIKENSKAVEDYRKGKQASIMFLVGQVMRKIGKKIDAGLIKITLEKELDK